MNNDNHHQAAWSDFNNADAQQGEFNLIPKGTQALVRMAIKPGGHDDASKGWTGGYATASDETGAVFLSCEFVLLTGPFAKRKIWSNVGLHSNKGPTWAQMGRSFIKAVLNSSRNIHPDDNSPEAQRARQIRSFGDLDGAEFAARIGIEKDGQGEYVIFDVEIRDMSKYQEFMKGVKPALDAAGARYLARGGTHKVYEGDWKRRVILQVIDRDHPVRCIALQGQTHRVSA